MAKTDTQIIVLGSSLGARLAAVLLARQGQQVTHLCPAGEPVAGWDTAPPLLVRFLDLLDARTCLRAAPPRAVLTRASRIELHGSVDLRDELRRELGGGADRLLELLEKLQRSAERLSEFFWEIESVPVSLAQRLVFPGQLLKHRLSGKPLRGPAGLATRQLEAEAAELLKTCIGGHVPAPFDTLSLAELALIWGELASPQAISLSSLHDLLTRRLQKAGGIFQPLDPEASLDLAPGRAPGVVVADREYSAAHVLVGTGLAPGLTHLPSLSGGYARTCRLEFLSGAPSEILPERIVSTLHGGPPLRIQLAGPAQARWAEIGLPFHTPPLAASEVTGWLEELFPFCRLRLTEETPGCPLPKRSGLPGRHQPFQLSAGHYWNVSGAAVFPSLLNTGECLAAMTLAARLSG